ncbi:DUF3005 domain-containing protein [Robbsia andropogonis]|uniref:DUF3005 domain-containing protein n=1 Tax=Robbsia andropogonis TaxID=28092 RepID=UPI002A6B4056|nr:DUF3005 domain-containing protein [Robbsia andropogonis]
MGTTHSYSKSVPSELPEDVVPRGVDLDNDVGSDSTVDADGKNRDARRQAADAASGTGGGLDRQHDNEVVSNATLQNAVRTPPTGLAGIDSRPDGASAGVLAAPGSHVVDVGFVEASGLYETAGDDSDTDATEGARKRLEHIPQNHTRVGHNIKFEPDTDVKSPRSEP